MIKLLFICFIWFGICWSSNAQSTLYEEYQSLPKDRSHIEKRIKLLETIIAEETYNDFRKALILCDTLSVLHQLTEAPTSDNATYFARYALKGRIYAAQRKYVKALQFYKRYSIYCDKATKENAYFFVDVGNIYFYLHFFDMAHRFYREAEEIALKIKCEECLSTVHLNFSLIARERGQYQKAIQYLHKKLEFEKEIERSNFFMPYTYNAIGRVHYASGKNYEKAITAFDQAIKIIESELKKSDNPYYYTSLALLAEIYVFKGLTLQKSAQQIEGSKHITKGLQFASESEDPTNLVADLSFYVALSLVEKNQYQQAYNYLKTSQKVYAKGKNYFMLLNIYENLMKTASSPKIFNNYLELYKSTRDTVDIQNERLLMLNEAILQQEKEQTIAKQKLLIQTNNKVNNLIYTLLWLVIGILTVSIIIAWYIWRKNKIINKYAKELESANQIKDLTMSIVGHDLRTPFSNILMNANQVLTHLEQHHLQKAEKSATRTSFAAKKAYMLMDGLMQWAMLQQREHRKINTTASIALKQVLIDIVDKLEGIATLSQIKIVLSIPAQITIISNTDLLEIIIRNILVNMIQHTPSNGKIEISAQPEGEKIVLKLKDQGNGLPSHLLGYLKPEPKDAIKIAKKGNGLGLNIVRELATMLQLPVLLRNGDQNGAIFELFFETSQPATTSMPSPVPVLVDEAIATQIDKNIDNQILAPYAQELKKYELFEGSAIISILNKIDDQQLSENAKSWKKQIQKCMTDYDEAKYQTLLEQF